MGERSVLEAVVFDAGGTLGRLDFEWMAEAVRALGHALDAEALRMAEIEGRRRYDASIGVAHAVPRPGEPPPPLGVTGDTHAYFRGMLVAAGVPEAAIPAVLERWLERQRSGPGLWTRRMEGAGEALAGVRALGLRRAVVSNSDGRAEQHIRDWGFSGDVEFVIDSHVVGIEKPDPRIFAIALERLALPAARALYVGDIRGVDEVGSRAAGLHFVLIDPTGEYAAPGAPHIRRIADLPPWIERQFDTPPIASARAAEASEPTTRSRGPGGSS
jgi:putative hydrolase of the HAD superfamily